MQPQKYLEMLKGNEPAEPETLKYVSNPELKQMHGRSHDPLIKLLINEVLCLRDENWRLLCQNADIWKLVDEQAGHRG